MLMPKRTKWRKQMKGRNRGKAFNGHQIEFGDIAIKATEAGRIIFEMAGVDETLAREALTLAIHKMPFKCKIVALKDTNELY